VGTAGGGGGEGVLRGGGWLLMGQEKPAQRLMDGAKPGEAKPAKTGRGRHNTVCGIVNSCESELNIKEIF